jgi:Transglutaminase-like superfamily
MSLITNRPTGSRVARSCRFCWRSGRGSLLALAATIAGLLVAAPAATAHTESTSIAPPLSRVQQPMMMQAPKLPIQTVTDPGLFHLPQDSAEEAAALNVPSQGLAALGSATSDINQLAAQLGTPENIFSWVRVNILSVPLWGVTQGAEGCLQTRQCDAHDTAMLLAALLNADGISTRYVLGVVQLSTAQFEQAMGGYTNLTGALDLSTEGGIPTSEVVNAGGQVTGVLLGEVWVQANLSLPFSDKANWVNLDAFLKPLRYIKPTSLAAVAGFGPTTIPSLSMGATSDASIPAITGFDDSGVSTAVTSWNSRVTAALQSLADQGGTIGDLTGGWVPDVPPFSLPSGPEGTVEQIVSVSSTIPASYYQTLSVTVGSGISLTMPVATLASSRLTIAFVPATAADATTINQAGGLYNVQPSLVTLVPVVSLNGTPQAYGTAVAMGSPVAVNVTFNEPSGVTSTASHEITAGTFAAIGVSPGTVSGGNLAARTPGLLTTLSQLRQGSSVDLDSVLGEMLNDQAQEYYELMDCADAVIAGQQGVRIVFRPREMLMSFAPAFTYSGSTPTATVGAGFDMDLRVAIASLGPLDGSSSSAAEALLDLTMVSSQLENAIFQVSDRTSAISTVALLSDALTEGVPVAIVTPGDAATTSALLDLPAAYQQDIETAALNGNVVLATAKEVTSGNWVGAAWAILNPSTGASSYIIGGGLADDGQARGTDTLAGGGTSTPSTTTEDITNAVDSSASVLGEYKVLGPVAQAIGTVDGPFSWLINSTGAIDTMNQTYYDTGGNLTKAELAGQASLLINGGLWAVGTGLVGLGLTLIGIEALPALILAGIGIYAFNQLNGDIGKSVTNAVVARIEQLPIR